ncbi:uncharacterized protein [Dysidea avara]|uniref:uncharacterized protein isoform X5 n=1 Tax=Dysidea avara TaxID=196820 RepID=UPI00331C78AA
MSGVNSKVVDLSFLTEEEERNFRTIVNEDLQLQRAEELRLKQLRDDIENELENYKSQSAASADSSVCARCGFRFGIITHTGAMCPSCSDWICKQDRRYYSFMHTWICTLCEKRMMLKAGEEVLNRSVDPVNALRVSFRERNKKKQQQTQEKLKQQEKQNEEQQLKQQQQQEQHEQTPEKVSVNGNDQPAPTSKFPDATTTQPEQPLEPVITSGPADAGNQVGPITKPDDQPEILGITEPLPEPAMSLMVVSNTVDDGDEEEELVRNNEDDTVAKATEHSLVAPYPPGVIVKRNKTATIQGDILLKVYISDHKKLVVIVEKATGLGMTKHSKTLHPYAVGYILPDYKKLTKRKTKVESKTVDPVWNTTWEYTVPESGDFTGQVLWVSVWNWNRFSKADFLGEVMLPLWTMDLHDKSMKSYQLQPEQSVIQSAGELKLSLRYEPPEDDEGKKKKKKQVNGRLHVRIMEAKDLFYDKSYVKGFLRPGKHKAHNHQQTETVTQPKCPIYDEEMVFKKVTMDTLSTAHVLEVAVWDAQFITYPMGVIRLGPQPTADSKPWMDSQDAEVNHWEAMLSHPNEWVEQWHILRPDGDFRDVTKSNEDTLHASGDVTRSSPDGGGETSDDDDDDQSSQDWSASSQTMPTLVLPNGDDDDGEEIISLTFPRTSEKKAFLELDDYKSRSLTKEDTNMNSLSIGKSLSIHSNLSDVRSVYSGSVVYDNNEVTGEIQMGVSYSDTDNTLKVSINKIRGLTPPNKINEVHTNPYVKTYLLPDQSKSTKKKTSVKKGVDPIFNETIKYPIKRQELSKHTLKVGVWHNDFWRHNLFLGEVTLPLDKVDWSNPSDKWYELEELSHDDTSQSKDRGQLKVSLQFNITNDKKQKGDLVVTIISGHNLLQTELTCNPVVKCHLLPDYRKKFKTKVLKDSSNPEWNEQFVFDHLKLEDLRKNRVIELTVWNSTKNTKHYDFIGGLRLGPRPHHKKQLSYMDSSENELSHWMSVVNTPGECVITHTLRHNMNPLPVTLSVDETVDDINDAVIDEDIKCTPNFVLTHPDDSTDVFTTNQLPIITVKDDDNVSCFSQQICTPPPQAGDIRVMLQFDAKKGKNPKKRTKGCLHVSVQQARQLNLFHGDATFIQCSLLPRNKKESFKSEVVHGGDSPCYTAKFQFDKVTDVELSYDRVLEITIWEPHRNTNEFVGGIRLGPKPQPGNKNEWMDSDGSEVSQWETMVARPEEWIDEWHLLHSLMKPVVVPA